MLENAIVSAPATATARGGAAIRAGSARRSAVAATSEGAGPNDEAAYGTARRVASRRIPESDSAGSWARPTRWAPASAPTSPTDAAAAEEERVAPGARYVNGRPPRRPVAPVRVIWTNPLAPFGPSTRRP